jgi:hypothetical protein
VVPVKGKSGIRGLGVEGDYELRSVCGFCV